MDAPKLKDTFHGSHQFLTPLRRDGLIALAAVAAHLLYLLVAQMGRGHFGFPLDDAWIYQTYARNLARAGQWAFVAGVPSSGSTSVLWTLIVLPGHLLPFDPCLWTQAMGLLMLAALGLGAARLFPTSSLRLSLAVGLAAALEWHLAWAAASGMETALFAALLMWFWVWVRRRNPAVRGQRWQDGLWLGVWGGMLLLARPEGVLAAGVAGTYGLLKRGRLIDKVRWVALAAVGFALLLVPFLALNLSTSGTLWPNTFYAKQTEYAVLWQVPYLRRLFDQVAAAFVGPQVVLAPALAVEIVRLARRRPFNWAEALPLGWVLLHWALYAARLPVTHQHGRYAIPTVPLVVAYGVRGMVSIIKPRAQQGMVRVGSLTWLLAVVALFPLFLAALGAPAYAQDVDFIEMEMVATARWLAEHTTPDAVIAAHDIGALGYFAPRPLVDLAGLVSPDVLPYMHDADALHAYILASGAEYLVIFPAWSETYARLVARPAYFPIWSAAEQANYRPLSNLGPMTVYEVRRVGDFPRRAGLTPQPPLHAVERGSYPHPRPLSQRERGASLIPAPFSAASLGGLSPHTPPCRCGRG